MPDPARRVAYELLRSVRVDGAYANLTLPGLLRARRLSSRDAALATELGYGTLRAQGTLDAIVAACSSRAVAALDGEVLDLLRLGAYQLLRTRVPAHAAVASTVDLSRAVGWPRATGYINAVLRRVSERDWPGWVAALTADPGPVRRLALATAHPEWIVAAFAAALAEPLDGPLDQTRAALSADDQRPVTHLVALPGLVDRDHLTRAVGGQPGPWSPYAVRMSGGDPGELAEIRTGLAGVQDEGSQLVAQALTLLPVEGPDRSWLDLTAGPGGKTALLAALAVPRAARVQAIELHQHRADLIRARVQRFDPAVTVTVGDARQVGPQGTADRVLLDAPCTGLGALRRRPEARWRRRPDDVAQLAQRQGELLDAAVRAARPGGLIGYATCSPHPAETKAVVEAAMSRAPGVELVDARPAFPGVPELGPGPTVQLWPHRHGTDAMFCAFLRKPS